MNFLYSTASTQLMRFPAKPPGRCRLSGHGQARGHKRDRYTTSGLNIVSYGGGIKISLQGFDAALLDFIITSDGAARRTRAKRCRAWRPMIASQFIFDISAFLLPPFRQVNGTFHYIAGNSRAAAWQAVAD